MKKTVLVYFFEGAILNLILWNNNFDVFFEEAISMVAD